MQNSVVSTPILAKIYKARFKECASRAILTKTGKTCFIFTVHIFNVLELTVYFRSYCFLHPPQRHWSSNIHSLLIVLRDSFSIMTWVVFYCVGVQSSYANDFSFYINRHYPWCSCIWSDIINMLEFLVDNIFVVFGGKVFEQIVGIPMGTHCAPLLADIFLYSYEAEFIPSLLSTGKKNSHLSSTSHTDTSMKYCQSITLILRIIWVRCIPLSLRSKTRRRAAPMLPTRIYYCRSRVTVSCALPFTTNVTILTSISQTFRSRVATFRLRQPVVFLSHSSYGMPGLSPLMNVLF